MAIIKEDNDFFVIIVDDWNCSLDKLLVLSDADDDVIIAGVALVICRGNDVVNTLEESLLLSTNKDEADDSNDNVELSLV